MKTLASAQVKAEIARRITSIELWSRRHWGTMTVAEMICHLSDAFRVALGDRSAKPVKNRYTGWPMKGLALWLPFPWPHGVPTVSECDAKIGGTPPADLERDKDELFALIERFVSQPSVVAQHAHPFFGLMTEKEWMRWGYLHCDHHLRQFSV